MCLGSISPPETALLALSFNSEFSEESKPAVRQWKQGTPEEERCGEMCADGVRRFKHRKVLCSGCEVLVGGWLATVESLCMDTERVTLTYAAGSSTETVPLSEVRCVLTDPLNRDLQTHFSPAINSVFTFMDDLKKCLGMACPVLVRQ